MPPPPSRHPGAGGGRSECARSASGRARSPQPGPSGLGSGEQAAPCADRSRSGFHGQSSPTPSGAAEDDRDSVSGSVDLDRDDSFRAVLRLIREFHSLEEPASVAPNRCKTSLAPIYGLQSESSPALHLLLSPLLGSLLEDTNLALAKFVEDWTVHGFFLVPGRRHRRYYRTFSSSFPGPYTVPPGLASITLDKVSESQKHSVSLSPLPGLLFGDHVVQSLRGHLLVGLVAFHLRGFPWASTRWSPWQLRTVDALWVESPGVPGYPGRHGSRQSRVIPPRFHFFGCPVYCLDWRGRILALCWPSLVSWNFF